MDPLTVALIIVEVFSAVAGIIIGAWLVVPSLGSRKEAFMAASVGGAALLGLYLAMLSVGPAMRVVIIAIGTMIFTCVLGILREALSGF